MRKSKENGELLEEALRARVVGAASSGPPEPVRELFTSPTTTLDTSVEPNDTVDIILTDDTATRSVVHDTSA